jgi:hypothetical protein
MIRRTSPHSEIPFGAMCNHSSLSAQS